MIGMKKKNFIIIFDVPLEKRALARSIQRKLNKIGAEMLQQSVWKSQSFSDLSNIALTIKQEGGQATILRENIAAVY